MYILIITWSMDMGWAVSGSVSTVRRVLAYSVTKVVRIS